MKRNNGITLIALVVTIVVLLILAGVSISMLTGENGIITQAQKAKEQSEIGEEKEAISVAYSGAKIKKEGTEVTAKDVQDQFNYNETKANASGNIYVQFTESKRWYYVSGGKVEGPLEEELDVNTKTLVDMFKQAQADNCNLTHETCSNPNHLHVGDYLDYEPNTGSTSVGSSETGYNSEQTYTVDSNTTWRVLGLSEDGTQLMITTGSPIKKVMNSSGTEEWEKDPYLYLNSGEGYYNTNDDLTTNNILDKICKIYDSPLAEKTQSMRIEDINTAVGLTLDKEKNIMYKTADESKTSIEAYQGFFGQKYTYKIGDYAPENYLKEKYPSKYQSLTAKKANDTVDGTAFMFSYEDPRVIDPSSKLYEILFKGTTEGENYAKSYWLASFGVGIDGSSYCVFGPGAVHGGGAGTGYGVFGSGGVSIARWLAVRPVVYLRSDITVKDLTITESGTEQEWTTSLPGSYSEEDLEYGQIKN